jgi:hypothetical protein
MSIYGRRAQTAKGERSQLRRAALRALALAGVVAVSLLASACGGSSDGAKVAQVDTNTTASDSDSSNASGSDDPVAYSACMRRNGVGNFPDPDSQGRIKINSSGEKTGVDVDSPQFKAAQKACQKLLPNGGRPIAAKQAEEQQAMLKYAQCMRAHGVPKFPDPKPGGVFVPGTKGGVDPDTLDTPAFQAAQNACQKLAPGDP